MVTCDHIVQGAGTDILNRVTCEHIRHGLLYQFPDRRMGRLRRWLLAPIKLRRVIQKLRYRGEREVQTLREFEPRRQCPLMVTEQEVEDGLAGQAGVCGDLIDRDLVLLPVVVQGGARSRQIGGRDIAGARQVAWGRRNQRHQTNVYRRRDWSTAQETRLRRVKLAQVAL